MVGAPTAVAEPVYKRGCTGSQNCADWKRQDGGLGQVCSSDFYTQYYRLNLMNRRPFLSPNLDRSEAAPAVRTALTGGVRTAGWARYLPGTSIH